MTPIKVAMATKVWPPAGVCSSGRPAEGNLLGVRVDTMAGIYKWLQCMQLQLKKNLDRQSQYFISRQNKWLMLQKMQDMCITAMNSNEWSCHSSLIYTRLASGFVKSLVFCQVNCHLNLQVRLWTDKGALQQLHFFLQVNIHQKMLPETFSCCLWMSLLKSNLNSKLKL